MAGTEWNRIDGGVRSTSNLGVLAGEALDAVVCLTPMSSLDAPHVPRPTARAAAALRQAAGRRLGREARRVREAGIDVVLIQPTIATSTRWAPAS